MPTSNMKAKTVILKPIAVKDFDADLWNLSRQPEGKSSVTAAEQKHWSKRSAHG